MSQSSSNVRNARLGTVPNVYYDRPSDEYVPQMSPASSGLYSKYLASSLATSPAPGSSTTRNRWSTPDSTHPFRWPTPQRAVSPSFAERGRREEDSEDGSIKEPINEDAAKDAREVRNSKKRWILLVILSLSFVSAARPAIGSI